MAGQLRKPEGDAGRKTGEMMNAGNKHINLWTIEMLDVKPNDQILEIGMGNGFFVKEILAVSGSLRYSGVDYSEDMVKEAERINKQFVENGQASFVLGDAGKLPFPDASFNKAFTINTIYFWEDPKNILSEIKRVLTPDGILIVSLRPKSQMQNYPVVKYGFNLFTEEEVTELLLENGFVPLCSTEREEPDQVINGQTIKVESLMVMAEKGETT